MVSAAGKVKLLSLADITIDPGINPRAKGLNEATVKEYAEELGNGAEFPELVVYRSKAGTIWLSEGFHRAEAYKRAGVRKVACEVRDGERNDALVNACGSNRRHGLKRSNDDKRKAVSLLSAAFPEWSNPRVAEAAGVSVEFVRKMRPAEPGQTRVGADGKTQSAAHQVATVATCDAENPSKTQGSAADSPHSGATTSGTSAEAEPEKPAGDATGPADSEADEGADFVRHVESLCREMDQVAAKMRALKKSPLSYSIHVDSAVSQVEAARQSLWQGRPAHRCPYCKGEGCKACRQTGRVKKATYESGLEAVGGAA